MLRRARVLALAGCAVLALAGALFLVRPASDEPTRPPVRACLVDASAGVSRAPDWLGWVRAALREEVRAAERAGEEVLVAVYGEGAAVGFHPGAPRVFLGRLDGGLDTPFDPRTLVSDGATDLAAATEIAEGVLDDPRRPPGRLVLLGDGAHTGADPGPALARLARAGHGLRCVPPRTRHVADLGVRRLELPHRVEAGAPLVARAELTYDPGALAGNRRARVTVEVRSGPTRDVRTIDVALPAAAGALELPVDCGRAGFGRTEVTLHVTLEPPDRMPENDRASASVAAEGARVVLVVAAPESLPGARAWLAPTGASPAGLELAFVTLEAALAQLDGADALVTHDLPPGELSAPLVEAFVRAGGGWLATAGPRFLRDWTPGRPGPLHALLPLEPAEAEHGPRDVLLLVDGSGSMEGAPFETVRTAALDLVGSALLEDRVVLRFFTTGLDREVVLKDRGADAGGLAAREAARELLGLRVPHGSTFLLRSLDQLVAELNDRPPTETLAFLLSDGRDREALPDPLALASSLRGDLAAHGGRLVVIAVGDADRALLARLAGGDEAVRGGDTLGELAEIFQREVLGSRLVSGAALALTVVPRGRGSLAADALGEGGADERLSPVTRYVRCRLAPGAEVLWRGQDADPVLAVARAGLGRTAQLATRPSPDWAPGWSGRSGPEEPREFVGLLRWLARRPGPVGGPSARLVDGDLVLSDLPEETPVRLAVTVREPTGAELGRLEALPPQGLGRDVLRTRVAPVPDDWDRGARLVELELPDGPLPRLVAADLPAEFAGTEARLPGDLLTPRDPRARRIGATGRTAAGHPAAPWVLVLGLGMLFLGALASGRAIKGPEETTDRAATRKEAPAPRS